MSRGSHRKLYYVPGLISLILVPLFFAHVGKKQLQKLDLKVIEINFWHPIYADLIPFPERNYSQFVLTGDAIKDKAAITKAEIQAKNLYTLKDTVDGVHLVFRESVSYGTFVNIINNLKENNVTRYIPYKNNLWILYPSPPRRVVGEIPIPAECFLCNDVVVISPAEKQLTTFQQIQSLIFKYTSGIKNLWPTIALLFMLAILTTIQIIRLYLKTLV